MQKVVLDTNALFFPFKFSINLEEEILQLVGRCEIVVPDVAISELEKLRREGNKEAGAANKFLERFDRLTCNPAMKGDAAILDAAKNVNGILVTSDKELIRKAKAEGLKVIFLRGKQRLQIK